MPSITFDNWKGGLDLRQPHEIGPANILYVLTNAYITTGGKIRKRPCFTKVATLEAGTKGLRAAGGKLNTFYESGSITHANPLFTANLVPHPTVSQPVASAHYGEMFDGYLYCSIEYADGSVWHHYLDGTSPPRVTDVNCPHGKSVRKIGQKIYSNNKVASGNVAFCAITDPRDWTKASDAGFIAAGTEAAGSDEVTAIGEYQGDLAIFFSDSMQLWDVDADPSKNAIKGNATTGTTFAKTPTSFAGDLAYLGAPGFRTVTMTALTNNMQENDVGTAIDNLRSLVLDTDDPITAFYPKLGQLTTFNGAFAFCFSFSKTSKLSAWSYFTFPFDVDATTVLNNELYVRSGDNVYRMDRDVYADDGVPPRVTAEMFFQDFKSSGYLKQFYGFDAVVKGSPTVAFRFNPKDASVITTEVGPLGDTRPDELYPMEIQAVAIAPVVSHEANEEFELNMLQIYYDILGPL